MVNLILLFQIIANIMIAYMFIIFLNAILEFHRQRTNGPPTGLQAHRNFLRASENALRVLIDIIRRINGNGGIY